jgi:GNAT superfamily N-acetyltransferase
MYAAIVALQPADRARLEAHLLRLSPEDRSLRFAAGLVTDDTVRRYVAAIDFQRDLVLGLVSKRGWVIGCVHGCVFVAHGQRHVETAFSVDAQWRGHGFGTRLMEAIVARAAAEGGATLVGTCAVRNLAMRRVFERGEMALQREDDEMSARRQVAPLMPDASRQSA